MGNKASKADGGKKMRIVVTGATGKQGGAVVDHCLKNKLGTVVAITRNPDSDKAKTLKARGCEVVAADYDKPETLGPAFAGADAAFIVTDFFAGCGLDINREIAQGKAAVDALKAAGVKHAVFSTLEDPRPFLPDTVPAIVDDHKLPHFEGKNIVNEYGKQQLGNKWTSLYTSFFPDNFLKSTGFGMEPANHGQGYCIFIPCGDSKMAIGSVDDIGGVACKLIAQGPGKWGGKSTSTCGDHISVGEMAAAMTKVLGKPVAAVTPTTDEYIGALLSFGVPEPMVRDLANMYTYYRDHGENFLKLRPVKQSKEFYPATQSFEQWLTVHKDEMLADMP